MTASHMPEPRAVMPDVVVQDLVALSCWWHGSLVKTLGMVWVQYGDLKVFCNAWIFKLMQIKHAIKAGDPYKYWTFNNSLIAPIAGSIPEWYWTFYQMQFRWGWELFMRWCSLRFRYSIFNSPVAMANRVMAPDAIVIPVAGLSPAVALNTLEKCSLKIVSTVCSIYSRKSIWNANMFKWPQNLEFIM